MTPRRSVVLAAAEAVPFAKSGGLGDVTGALAAALSAAGARVTIVLPAYGHIDTQELGFQRLAASFTVPVGNRDEACTLWWGRQPRSDAATLLIDHPGYFHRAGMYLDADSGAEYDDAAARWIFFSRALLAALPHLGKAPDVLHLNDHHCALAAAYRAVGAGFPAAYLQHTAVVFGIHNLGYQGLYDAADFVLTGLPAACMAPLGPLEFWGRMNAMKAGLVLADTLVTVSPTYAREIQESPDFGFGLEGVLRTRHQNLFGILNGIDESIWDPGRDPLLPARFDRTRMEGKAVCKRALQERSGLPAEPRTPLFGIVSRLVEQKGIDLLLAALDLLGEARLQVVLLGRGDPEIEARLIERARSLPARLAVYLDFDDTLAHWIEAGSDFFLMPSRYEPCGLNQMYSMRYGTVPVVRRTGGLADTVQDWDGSSGTGFVFGPATAAALASSITRAVAVYQDDTQMQALRRAGMRQDFSWSRSARCYLEVYDLAVERRQHPAATGAVRRGGAARGH